METEQRKELIDGLTQDDWELVLKGLKGQLTETKLQRKALEGSISGVIYEIGRFKV